MKKVSQSILEHKQHDQHFKKGGGQQKTPPRKKWDQFYKFKLLHSSVKICVFASQKLHYSWRTSQSPINRQYIKNIKAKCT